MTDKQPLALKLADALEEKDYPPRRAAAAELRRLHEIEKKEWQGLTDEDIEKIHYDIKCKGMGAYSTNDIYRAIEAKLREKNNGH